MNRKTAIAVLLCALSALIVYPKHKTQLAPSYAWQLEGPLALSVPCSIDTLYEDYCQSLIPSAGSDAWITTGNYGTQGINAIWSERPMMSDFVFRDALERWIPTLDKMRFYNTRIPMTLLSYNTGGGKETTQDRLSATFSANINSKAQIGALLDYLYSKGAYANQSAKDLIWGFSGSYIGDRYEFQGFFNQYNLLNKENGGITDSLYILDPALIQGGVSHVDTKSIPVHLYNAHTRLTGKQLYMTHRYKVGFWREEKEGDSVVSRTYVPVTSFIWNFDYQASKHLFRDDASGEIANFFDNTYLDPRRTVETSSYWSISNLIGISLLEGFNKYAKFGLGAFVRYKINKYTQVADSLDRSAYELTPFPEGVNIAPNTTEHNISVGGQLSKHQGSILRYDATAEFGISGRVSGDVRLDGTITGNIPLLGDTVAVTGKASFTNTAPSFFTENFISNHFIWQNDFDKERHVTFGGAIDIAHTGSRIEVEVSNVQNHIYFGDDFLPTSYGGSVQIFSARWTQSLSAGALHWDNRITYQKSSKEEIISLPQLAVYSNLYLKFKIATLFVQFGVDCDYYTKFYAPKYNPATATFATQHEQKLGNYPLMNVYFNFKLSKTRFFVMMSHINKGWFSNNYFSMPGYPLNPSRLQLGLSVDFAN